MASHHSWLVVLNHVSNKNNIKTPLWGQSLHTLLLNALLLPSLMGRVEAC